MIMDEEIAAEAVAGILKDLEDRRGLSQEWGMIDEPIQQEIIETWRGAVVKALKRRSPLERRTVKYRCGCGHHNVYNVPASLEGTVDMGCLKCGAYTKVELDGDEKDQS